MVDRRTYTPDEYQSSFIDFYGGFGGIDTSKAPEVGEEIKPTTASPDIMKPVGTADDETNIFSGVNIGTGAPSFKVGDVDYKKYLEDFSENPDEKSKAGEDRSLGGFVEWAKNELQRKPEIAIGTATGIPGAGALAAVGASLNRKQQLKNANKISETGGTGGSMFKVGNQTISRAPGSRIYSGNLGGMTQQQVANLEAIKRGFIPGTMVETAGDDEKYNITGKKGLVSIDGAAMDAYGNIHSAGGPTSASQATALREKLFVDTMREQGISLAGVDVASAALEMKQALDASARGRIGVFETAARQDGSTYEGNRKTAQEFINKYVMDTHGSGRTSYDPSTDYGMGYAPKPYDAAAMIDINKPGVFRPTPPSSVTDSARMAGINVGPKTSSLISLDDRIRSAGQRYRDSGQKAADEARSQEEFQPVYLTDQVRREEQALQQDPGMFGDDDPSPAGTPTEYSMTAEEVQNYADSYADVKDYSYFKQGGRVGLQMGGAPGAPAGFVERPPSQVSEAATVADDKPMSVPEGTFVINAAAVEIAGEADIAKMLNKAYENYRVRGGKEVMGRTPSKEEIDVAVSRGEVIIPPHIAKIIGYDRLEKINNRGKKETSKRIEENGQRPAGAAGGGFLTRKKLANGGEIDYEDRIIADEVRRKMKEMLGSLPDDVTVTSEYYEDQPVARMAGRLYAGKTVSDYHQALADVAGMTPLTGKFKANPRTKKINVPQTPTLFNLFAMAEEIAHLDHLDKRRTNPYPDPEALGSFFNPSAQMNKEYSQYDRKLGAEKSFNPYEAFEKEERYREEMRAKAIAYETVQGMLPKSKKTADFTKLGYQESFAKYVYDNAPPVIRTGLFEKYPELQQFVDDKDRFVSKRTPVINAGVKEYNRRAREIEAQRKK